MFSCDPVILLDIVSVRFRLCWYVYSSIDGPILQLQKLRALETCYQWQGLWETNVDVLVS